ncbi:IS30 family transposase [Halosquirtibacter xylanolyticus]|uniref:IS30 family transposase n=1 Tax=Halosquirtibacter xylanolyticus TaxID=3374599 RepID=UPI003749ABA0|nr:IS30 family transposase [Prolixibacteraceae bacterium]QZT38659.1 IS30 family transposase [Prolixibacteraceae bacterium]QZT38846.1 IS30 family transposase [Prolixibacteraceae bacterium]
MGQLVIKQRYLIELMLATGASFESIGSAINKNKSVISREVKRNSNPETGCYCAIYAEALCRERHRNKRKQIVLDGAMKDYIKHYLEKGLSPEQINGRSKLKGISCVSHETIYTYIWEDKIAGGEIYKSLRRKHKKYSRRGAKNEFRGKMEGRVSIDQRPKIVEEKQRFGDLEIDTIIGKNRKGAILTINDRSTGLCWIRLLNGKNAKALAKQTIDVLTPFKDLIHTITSDNGREFYEHKHIAESLKVDFYFAHPYHSWERGANENLNGLIRQYIPKGSSFENLTQKEIDWIQAKLNNRPRKRYGYHKPIEMYNKLKLDRKVAFVA